MSPVRSFMQKPASGRKRTVSEVEAEADRVGRRVAVPETRGRPGALPEGLARRLQHEIGVDFAKVRVHADASAARKTASHGAAAMSEGRDLYFGAGQFSPETPDGAFLVAHEAVHAAQQGFADGERSQDAGRYFKKPDRSPPKADPRDIFNEVKQRAPDLAVFIDVKTLNDAIKGNTAVGPAVPGGTSGTDVHEWRVAVAISQTQSFSMTGRSPIVSKKRTRGGQLVTHLIPIVWGTSFPLGSPAELLVQAAAAERAKALPKHAARAKDFAFELALVEPLLHELLHARVIMERDPSFSAGPASPLVQAYLDIIAASRSAAVKPQRDAVRGQIAVLAGLHVRKPAAAELAAIVDEYDEFLVHEKYDAQKVYAIMARSGATNQAIAKAYSGVIDRGLTALFGASSISSSFATEQRLKLETAAVAYFKAIDAALAGSGGSTPAPAGNPQKPTPP